MIEVGTAQSNAPFLPLSHPHNLHGDDELGASSWRFSEAIVTRLSPFLIGTLDASQ